MNNFILLQASDDKLHDSITNWMHNNPGIFAKGLSLVILAFGIFLVVGAVKDWNWLYAPDGEYHNNWSMGQISRYLGRRTARIIGGCAGLFFFIPLGGVLTYGAFFKY